MSTHHNDRALEIIAHEAAGFITREAGPASLITVTRAIFTSRSKDRVTVFITVFPDEKIHAALSFLDRQREEFSDHLKKSTRLRPLPRVEFMLDDGEKNRQRVDEISNTL